jgi:hypothetical protein
LSELKDIARFMYGDVKSSEGFWYSHVLRELEGLPEEKLFWVFYGTWVTLRTGNEHT